jgi:hypothetical protein
MARKRVTQRQRSIVAQRAHGCCEYCRCPEFFSPVRFSIEHILPQSTEEEIDLENLALACQACNNHKYDKTQGFDPITGELVSLFHPRRETWKIHFAWSFDYTLIVGLTPTGRATIETLQLNRQNVVNVRAFLYEVGKHPPAEIEAILVIRGSS